jgi:hypothetical protein
MSTIFLGPALLRLAQDASVCDEDGSGLSSSSLCRVYGRRPTSLLTNIGVFGGILSTALTPLFGEIVDHTPHSLHVGRISVDPVRRQGRRVVRGAFHLAGGVGAI